MYFIKILDNEGNVISTQSSIFPFVEDAEIPFEEIDEEEYTQLIKNFHGKRQSRNFGVRQDANRLVKPGINIAVDPVDLPNEEEQGDDIFNKKEVDINE